MIRKVAWFPKHPKYFMFPQSTQFLSRSMMSRCRVWWIFSRPYLIQTPETHAAASLWIRWMWQSFCSRSRILGLHCKSKLVECQKLRDRLASFPTSSLLGRKSWFSFGKSEIGLWEQSFQTLKNNYWRFVGVIKLRLLPWRFCRALFQSRILKTFRTYRWFQSRS